MAIQPSRRRFAVSEFHRMATAGILGEDDRVELIDGSVVQMTPIGRRHAGSVNRLTKMFVLAFGDDAVIGPQNPIVLGDYSEPQPDLAVLRPRADFYTSAHPTAADVLLLVELGETSADLDRRRKVPLYAQRRRRGVAGRPAARDGHHLPGAGKTTLSHRPGCWPRRTHFPSSIPRPDLRRCRHSRMKNGDTGNR